MRLAWGSASTVSAARSRALIAALLGGTALLGGLVLFYFSGVDAASVEGSGVPWIAVMLGVAAVMVVGLLLVRRD